MEKPVGTDFSHIWIYVHTYTLVTVERIRRSATNFFVCEKDSFLSHNDVLWSSVFTKILCEEHANLPSGRKTLRYSITYHCRTQLWVVWSFTSLNRVLFGWFLQISMHQTASAPWKYDLLCFGYILLFHSSNQLQIRSFWHSVEKKVFWVILSISKYVWKHSKQGIS